MAERSGRKRSLCRRICGDWLPDSGGGGTGQALFEPAPAVPASAGTVPAAFPRLAETVLCHSDPGRFALLYRLLVRLQADRRLLEVASDADVVLAARLAKAVRRDSHKMTAFVRFKEVPLPPETVGRRRFLAWFEPDHFIVARMAPFFRRRFADMDWVIVTPKGSASWDGERLAVSDLPAEKPDLEDATDDLWRTYYASIFNPARLKIGMMQKEMPKKYWKNLPEAALIPELIASAERRVIDMAARAPTEAPAFHARLRAMEAARGEEGGGPPPSGAQTLAGIRAEAAGCARCPIHCGATQTVFGEGPERAAVMFVGEQPGDEEDLAGRPFVGPAGKVLSGAMADAGLDRRHLHDQRGQALQIRAAWQAPHSPAPDTWRSGNLPLVADARDRSGAAEAGRGAGCDRAFRAHGRHGEALRPTRAAAPHGRGPHPVCDCPSRLSSAHT